MTAKRFFTLVAMTVMLATATAAQDADSLYAKGLLQPGTERGGMEVLYDCVVLHI